MLRRVALVRTDVSEELSATFIRGTRIGELGTTLAVANNRRTLRIPICSVRRLIVTVNIVHSSPIPVTLMKEALIPIRSVRRLIVTARVVPSSPIPVTLMKEALIPIRSVRRLIVTANIVPSSPIPVTLMKEALSSSETSVLTRATRRNISEDATLHSHLRENLNLRYQLYINRSSQLHISYRSSNNVYTQKQIYQNLYKLIRGRPVLRCKIQLLQMQSALYEHL
jgi:hypothetical protein